MAALLQDVPRRLTSSPVIPCLRRATGWQRGNVYVLEIVGREKSNYVFKKKIGFVDYMCTHACLHKNTCILIFMKLSRLIGTALDPEMLNREERRGSFLNANAVGEAHGAFWQTLTWQRQCWCLRHKKIVPCQPLPYLEQPNSPTLPKLCVSTSGRNVQVI